MKNGRRRIQTGSLSPVIIVANLDIFLGNEKERDGAMRKRQQRLLSDLDFAIELFHVKYLVRQKPDIIEQPGVCD